jgi:glutamyl-tRNA reductase
VERVFAAALHAGRLARSWRQAPTRSIATVALDVMVERAGSLEGRDLLIVGAGRMGRLAAQAARDVGASVRVASRSRERAERVARLVGAWAVAFDPGPAELEGSAGVIVALGGPWGLGADSVRSLATGQAVIVDLSVPMALPAEVVRDVPIGRLVSADDLARVETADTVERVADERVDRLIEQTTRDVQAWLAGHARRAAAAALTERSDVVRAAALAGLWRDLPDLDPTAREAIDQMTRHLAEQLLREPLERLGRDVDGHTESAVREVFAL